MNHLRMVLKTYPAVLHGLRKEDVERVDRQNFASAQRLIKRPVIECLEMISSGKG